MFLCVLPRPCLFAVIVWIALAIPVQVRAENHAIQVQHVNPDVIGCLKAIEPLSLSYRSRLQLQCAGITLDICETFEDEIEPCLSEVVSDMRKYYEQLMPLLPSELELKGYRSGIYARAIVRLRKSFGNFAECDGLCGQEHVVCEFVELAVIVTDLFYRAREARVTLP